MRHSTALLAATCFLSACADPTGLPSLRLGPGLSEVYAASSSSLRAPVRQLINDGPAWTSLWDTLQPGVARPTIDFGAQQLLVASLGDRPTGGYVIHIDSLLDLGPSRMAYVTTYRPGAGCYSTTALTQPVHVVATPLMGSPIAFAERTVSYDCE